MNDVYQAPEAELTEFTNSDEYGSVEKAVLGEYDFNISDALNEAWEKTKGNKLNFFLCGLVYWILLVILEIVTAIPTFFDLQNAGLLVALTVVGELVYYAISLPLGIGLGFLGIRVAMGESISPGNLFDFYPKTLKIFLVYLLMFVLIMLGFLLLILPGIYLCVAYIFAAYLVADKDMGIWEALETSRKAVTKRWWGFFGFFFVLGCIVLVGMLAFLIGLLWAVPVASIAFGIAYRNLFGVEAATLAKQ